MAPKQSAKTPTKPAKPAVKSTKLPKNLLVRPSDPSTSSKHVLKLHVNEEFLESCNENVGTFFNTKIVSGDLVKVFVEDSISRSVVAQVHARKDGVEFDTVQMSLELRYLGEIKLGDRVKFEKLNYQPPYAKKVVLCSNRELSAPESERFKNLVQSVGILVPGMRIEDVFVLSVDGARCELENIADDIEELSDQLQDVNLDTASESSVFLCKNTSIDVVCKKYTPKGLQLLSSLGGVAKQVKLIKKLAVVPLQTPEVFARFNVKPNRGILIHGAPGTGKTHILKALSNEFFANVHILRVSGEAIVSKYLGEAEQRLKTVFQEAQKYQPSLILIDEIDSLLPSRDSEADSNDTRILAALIALMDSIDAKTRVLIVGATNRPNDVDVSLRRPGRFDKEIEIGIPDAAARKDILQKILQEMKNVKLSDADVDEFSSRTHGYVGADLVALIREAAMHTIERSGAYIERSDVESAIVDIRPSAMREVILEMPKVRWTDIGGQEVLKAKLREMVQLPLQYSDTFKKLGVTAPKGVLLYGPPGCSKTLTAKALATESGLNFLAVKGPEIFNKYVGESERTIREIFRKARAAAPSIIFFDEIDALSPDRFGDSDNNSTSASGNVLTTLLNEIDGVEELKGVIIVGATNKPGSLDPALLRPGRLDRHIYVGPPDYDGRLQILRMQTAKFGLPAEQKEEFLQDLATQLEGFSGAEIVLVCQEAGIAAIMENGHCDKVDVIHFEGVMRDAKTGITQEMLQYYADFSSKSD